MQQKICKPIMDDARFIHKLYKPHIFNVPD